MILYLTSSPCAVGADRAVLNSDNAFVCGLRSDIPPGSKCLYIASSPDDPEANSRYSADMYEAFREAEMEFREMKILQRTNAHLAAELVRWSDMIILAGGHVPTQNAFFHEIGLGRLLRQYSGVIMGISAGTMNCAAMVYAQPELPGEAVDPDYLRFLPGLGLTYLNILPHYQQEKDTLLDGQRLYEDITCADSFGHRFLVLPDGSYVCVRGGHSQLFGEAYFLEDGVLRQVCRNGQSVLL